MDKSHGSWWLHRVCGFEELQVSYPVIKSVGNGKDNGNYDMFPGHCM